MQTPRSKYKTLDYTGLRQAIISLLGRRDYSRKELYLKYKDRVESLEDLDIVLEDFAERGWQCDTRFCESFLNSRCYRYGPIRLRFELSNKGITDARDGLECPSIGYIATKVFCFRYTRPKAERKSLSFFSAKRV